MPVLAARISGGPSSEPGLRPLLEGVIARLAAEFLTVPLTTVDRCVVDAWACAEHLGLDVTPEIAERVAREHLLGLVNSAPPSRV
ncbi:hypothetical protein GCM10009530_12860 [Microbispora corallina]|uniref:Uncharacterized protein n=1 Tax=Microbispora corallina TaxID=83302 RepID=A0ABQ4FT62_9ACTN|nr:hypothetical protein [Microbispora corallina]GIH38017.1 hypothetical protein Mco01_10170 [Microbispora corallina]